MSSEIVRSTTPEENELLLKREEYAAVRTALAERELELADFRAQFGSFEGQYLRQVGVLYAELDDWDAKIAELETSLRPSSFGKRLAQETRRRASESYAATHGEAAQKQNFRPSVDLKSLFREAAKRLHPDFAVSETDSQLRTRLMAEANQAYSLGDAEALQRILVEFGHAAESVEGEGIGAELIRIIRQIHQARTKMATLDETLAALRSSEIAQLYCDWELATESGRDLLAELESLVRKRIVDAKNKCKILEMEVRARDRAK